MDVMYELAKLDAIRKVVVHLAFENHTLKKKLDKLGELERVCEDCTFDIFSVPKGRKYCSNSYYCADKSRWKLREMVL
jgi:hypothetical protein